jgi:hypothetical protein
MSNVVHVTHFKDVHKSQQVTHIEFEENIEARRIKELIDNQEVCLPKKSVPLVFLAILYLYQTKTQVLGENYVAG